MVVNKVKEGRKLTEIKFSNDHYLANLLATTKVLGISLERAKKLCRTVPGKRVEVNPPIEIISKLNTDKLFEELVFLVNNLSKVKYESNYYFI